MDLDNIKKNLNNDTLKIIYNIYKQKYIKKKCCELNDKNIDYANKNGCVSMKYSAKILEYLVLQDEYPKLIDYQFDLMYL
jgi:hypothetical protein